uniref:Uncharacterized protein n=1 Tax=Panagrellus redivivus TaxID=6233 RepID=A0A7E4VYL0_PANRE
MVNMKTFIVLVSLIIIATGNVLLPSTVEPVPPTQTFSVAGILACDDYYAQNVRVTLYQVVKTNTSYLPVKKILYRDEVDETGSFNATTIVENYLQVPVKLEFDHQCGMENGCNAIDKIKFTSKQLQDGVVDLGLINLDSDTPLPAISTHYKFCF